MRTCACRVATPSRAAPRLYTGSLCTRGTLATRSVTVKLSFNFTIDFKRTPKPEPVVRESDTYSQVEAADDFKPYFQPVEEHD